MCHGSAQPSMRLANETALLSAWLPWNLGEIDHMIMTVRVKTTLHFTPTYHHCGQSFLGKRLEGGLQKLFFLYNLSNYSQAQLSQCRPIDLEQSGRPGYKDTYRLQTDGQTATHADRQTVS